MAQPRLSLILLLDILILLRLLILSRATDPKNQISAVDLSALHEIKNTLHDLPGTNFFSTWNSASPDPCSTFAGLTCSSQVPKRVFSLTLGTGLSDSPGLIGSLSPSLSKLTELTQLILFPGFVSGPIPPQLGTLTNLRVISLTKNRLTGPIPLTLSSLPNLHTLDLSFNQLTGSIPPGLSTSNQMKVLILSSNRLSGNLPDLFPAQLLHLDLKNNRLFGPLPDHLPLELRYLSLSGNGLWGPLNNGLQSLSELVYLDLSSNHFSGSIPFSLLRPSLSSLFLQRNNLSEWVPQYSRTPSSYGPGSTVDLSHNSLTGEPTPILATVESLFLNNNRLIGSVPVEYINSVRQGSTKTLYLQHNYISGFNLESGLGWPDSASVCLSYNCMLPPEEGIRDCPASAGGEITRPMYQCSAFNNGSSSTSVGYNY